MFRNENQGRCLLFAICQIYLQGFFVFFFFWTVYKIVIYSCIEDKVWICKYYLFLICSLFKEKRRLYFILHDMKRVKKEYKTSKRNSCEYVVSMILSILFY